MPPAAADSTLLSSSPSGPSVLVVFDFDHSLVNDDSDIFIFKELQPALLLELQDRWPHTQWTQLIDELLQRLALERPELSADDIRQTLARIPVQPRMLDAVRLAVESYGAELHIVSDANTVFIESMLEHHGLAPLVRKVHTNPSHFETLDGSAADNAKTAATCLRVERYHSPQIPPHGCPHCPVNMCKGRILDAIQRDRAFTHVLYVGDGKGDFCPVTHLVRCVLVSFCCCCYRMTRTETHTLMCALLLATTWRLLAKALSRSVDPLSSSRRSRRNVRPCRRRSCRGALATTSTRTFKRSLPRFVAQHSV